MDILLLLVILAACAMAYFAIYWFTLSCCQRRMVVHELPANDDDIWDDSLESARPVGELRRRSSVDTLPLYELTAKPDGARKEDGAGLKGEGEGEELPEYLDVPLR